MFQAGWKSLQHRFFHTGLIVWVSAEIWNFKRVLQNWKFCSKIRKPSDLGVTWAVTRNIQISSTSHYFFLLFCLQALLQDGQLYLHPVMPFCTINIENTYDLDPQNCQQSDNLLKAGLRKTGSPQCRTSVSKYPYQDFSPYNRILPDWKKFFGNYTLIHKQNPRSRGFFHHEKEVKMKRYFWLGRLKNPAANQRCPATKNPNILFATKIWIHRLYWAGKAAFQQLKILLYLRKKGFSCTGLQPAPFISDPEGTTP